jgi:hypothetical protein
MVAQVEILSERDGPAGWVFTAQVLDGEGVLRRHEVTLAWADYNLWSGSGADEPARVAAAVLRFLLTKQKASELPSRLDAATARRRYPDADAEIPGLFG